MVGLGVHLVTGGGLAGSAATLWFAGACYLVAGLLGTRMAKDLLGPLAAGEGRERRRPRARRRPRRTSSAGLAAGLRHLNQRRRAAYALGAVGVHRALYGTLLVEALLLYRNYFFHGRQRQQGARSRHAARDHAARSASAWPRWSRPQGVKRLTKDQWITVWLLIGGMVTILVLGPTFNQYAYLAVGFALGLSAQCVKICVDTTVQQTVDDAYMGRVFSLYDMLYNVAYVLGPAIAIPFLPADGQVLPGGARHRRAATSPPPRCTPTLTRSAELGGGANPLPRGPRKQFGGSPLGAEHALATSRSSSR